MSLNRDLTVGKPRKVLLRFCLPLFASIIFQQLYNIADSFVAGKFIGNDALAAVLSKTALGTTGIWLAWPIGWTIATALSLIFYGTADWKKYVKKSEKSIPVEAENDEAELEMQTE